jgi:hypothetical protein
MSFIDPAVAVGMPYWMQIRCISWAVRKTIPVVSVWGGPKPMVRCTNKNVLPQTLATDGARFLVHFNSRHLICCRVVYNSTMGRMQCVLMDTIRDEFPGGPHKIVGALSAISTLPSVLRNVVVDPHCAQQRVGEGGCVAMSIANTMLMREESATAEEGDLYIEEFRRLNPDITGVVGMDEQMLPFEIEWEDGLERM